jgi:hypothetical protein
MWAQAYDKSATVKHIHYLPEYALSDIVTGGDVSLSFRLRWLFSALLPCFLTVVAMAQNPAPSASPTSSPESSYAEERDWATVCEQAMAKPLAQSPHRAKTAAHNSFRKSLSSCDSSTLYYGIGQAPDYEAALHCALYERAHPDPAVGNMFAGPGVLAMLYANGRGVPLDYNRAIRYACEIPWAAEAEMALRVGHLEYLRDHAPANAAFDLCDDITSGLNDGACTSIQTSLADVVRDRKIAAIADQLPAESRHLFRTLQAAEQSFEDARVSNEVDLSGSSHAAFELEDAAKLRDQFLLNLERMGRGDLPAASATDLAALDRQLNELYQKLQHAPKSQKELWGTIRPEGIRATERKWLLLLEAWVKFSKTAYPKLAETSIRAHLLSLRLEQLRELDSN